VCDGMAACVDGQPRRQYVRTLAHFAPCTPTRVCSFWFSYGVTRSLRDHSQGGAVRIDQGSVECVATLFEENKAVSHMTIIFARRCGRPWECG
jgi:hypothetical protein